MRISAVFGLAGALSAAITLAAAAEPVTIRIDWSSVPGSLAPLMPTVGDYNPDIYRHYGTSYVVEPIRIAGGGAVLTALAAGEIDVGAHVGPQALVLGVVQGGLELRTIGQALTTEFPPYLETHFWVRKDEIQSVEDLRGKVLAVTARGANTDSALQIVMSRAGMQEPRDYQIVEVRHSAMLPSLESQRVDAVPLVPPFNREAAANEDLAPLFSVGDAFGPVETLMFTTTKDFLDQHRAALVDFMEDHIRMRRWMMDPETRPEALQQVADFVMGSVDDYQWVYTEEDYYFHPDVLVNTERLQNNVETLHSVGVIPEVLDVVPYVDMSIVEEARARIED